MLLPASSNTSRRSLSSDDQAPGNGKIIETTPPGENGSTDKFSITQHLQIACALIILVENLFAIEHVCL